MATLTKVFELSDEQQNVVDRILRFPKQVQVVGGLAGTGKSVIASELGRRLSDFAVCAYTGKAASVLRGRGVVASTIHSLIYRTAEVEYFDEELDDWRVRLVFELRDKDSLYLRQESCQEYEEYQNNKRPCKGFIIDESSMVGSIVHSDLLTFGLPIIYIGDHGQLPPVMSGVLDIMRNPDYKLETIHRNAGEIARFADFLRKGGHAADWESEGAVTIGHDLEGMYNAEQSIVAFNESRVRLNKMVRDRLGLPPDKPVVGDRIMCLKNNRELGIYNGQQGIIGTITEPNGAGEGGLVFLVDGRQYKVGYSLSSFNCKDHKDLLQRRATGEWIPFDYCYAVTAHKAQGSEFGSVAVLEQRHRAWNRCNWAYTAASRAKVALLWVINPSQTI